MPLTWCGWLYLASLFSFICAQCDGFSGKSYFSLPGINQANNDFDNIPTYHVGDTIQFTWYTDIDSVSLKLFRRNSTFYTIASEISDSTWSWVNAQPAALAGMPGETIFFMEAVEPNNSTYFVACSTYFKIIDPGSSSTTTTLAPTSAISTDSPATQTSAAATTTANRSPSSSNKSVAIGAGVGVPVGLIVLGALGAEIIYLMRRKRDNKRKEEAPMFAQYETAYGAKNELHGDSTPMLSSQSFINEAPSTPVYHEAPAYSINRHHGPPMELPAATK